MQLRTEALDCLYLNWALPRSTAPVLPEPLSYEVHEWRDREWVFASALLFRHSGLRLSRLPLVRLSYPQMNLRLYVFDGDGVPSVIFRCMLVPPWIVPLSRYFGRQPASAARFHYPSPSGRSGVPGSDLVESGLPEDVSWSWTVRRGRTLEVAGRLASPKVGPGPSLGSWEQTVAYFRDRRRGYVLWEKRLRQLHLSRPPVEVWPLEVEVGSGDLVTQELEDGLEADHLRHPHSSWLCPEIPFVFELGKPILLRLAPGGVPAAEGC